MQRGFNLLDAVYFLHNDEIRKGRITVIGYDAKTKGVEVMIEVYGKNVSGDKEMVKKRIGRIWSCWEDVLGDLEMECKDGFSMMNY